MTALSMPDIICDLSQEAIVHLGRVQKSFESKYKSKPDMLMRVPGRVNLIGEHIDYMGYHVCPMAIEQSIFVAVKRIKEPEKIFFSNIEDHLYADTDVNIRDINITKRDGAPQWYEYLLCGFKGVFEHTKVNISGGLMFHMCGTIPTAAGLSSSSALVCAAALATNILFEMGLTKVALADISASAERYIGTQGGGMDQAVIFNAQKNKALQINFNPLTFRQIELPIGGTFVIANSMMKKNKAASADFNIRVAECRLGALMIAKKYTNDWKKYVRLSEVQKMVKGDLGELIGIAKDTLHEGVYTKKEVYETLALSESELDQFIPENTRPVQQFRVRDRVLHVFEEAQRVEQFCQISQNSKSLIDMGRMMNESHRSLQELYECSHPELDRLVTTCVAAGAYGARLTGAGWGGCMIALVPSDIVEKFVAEVKNKFYSNADSGVDLNKLIFVTTPNEGANFCCPL